VASLKEGELQAEPTHFGKKQSGKTLNSTISTITIMILLCRIKPIAKKNKKTTFTI